MPYEYTKQHVTDEDRRAFLKIVGASSAVAAGSATLDTVQETISGESAAELAPIGQAIKGDLAAALDAELIAAQQAAFSEQASELSVGTEVGLSGESPSTTFAMLAEAGRPLYTHLVDTGFFTSTTEHLPNLTPAYLESSIQTFVGSEVLTESLEPLELTGTEGVDLVATVIAHADEISEYHWVATDQIPRQQIEFGEAIPPMTQGVAGGLLLWLEDLDTHLWQKQVILTDEIRSAANWHARSMAAGFHLMSEGAKAIAEESTQLSNSELAALLSTGFAVQAISQNLLLQDVYWIDQEMRGPRRTDLETITEY